MCQAGERYAGATLESYRLHGTEAEQAMQSSSLAAIQEFCNQMPRVVRNGGHAVFLGSVGVGKDHLMIGMIRRAIEAGCTDIKWADAAEMFSEFKDCLKTEVRLGEMIQLYVKPQLLVISDLLPINEALTQFESEMLFRIVHSRQRRLKATWVNANVATREEAASKIGEKILSRLEQDSLVLRMQWSDYRRKAR